MVFLRHIDEVQLLDRQCNEVVKTDHTGDKEVMATDHHFHGHESLKSHTGLTTLKI